MQDRDLRLLSLLPYTGVAEALVFLGFGLVLGWIGATAGGVG